MGPPWGQLSMQNVIWVGQCLQVCHRPPARLRAHGPGEASVMLPAPGMGLSEDGPQDKEQLVLLFPESSVLKTGPPSSNSREAGSFLTPVLSKAWLLGLT